MAEPETYYDLFLLEWGRLRDQIVESPHLPAESDAYRMLTSGTPSRVMSAVEYFQRVFNQARAQGDNPARILVSILALYGAPDVPVDEAEQLVERLESLARIILECSRK